MTVLMKPFAPEWAGLRKPVRLSAEANAAKFVVPEGGAGWGALARRGCCNAVPLTSSLGPGSVQLQVLAPDGPTQLPATAPSQLQAAVEREEQESNARGQGHRARVAELRAAAANQEARLRGLAADSEASAREREATRLRAERELSSLFARRDAALRRAHEAQQQAAGARAQATSEARARSDGRVT
jgi:hypothetical protein